MRFLRFFLLLSLFGVGGLPVGSLFAGEDALFLQTGKILTRKGEPKIPQRLRQGFTQGKSLHLIQCQGPLQDKWIRDLDASPGLRRVSYLAKNAYLLWLDASEVATLRQHFPFIQWDGPYHPWYKIHPRLNRATEDTVDLTIQWVDHPKLHRNLLLVRRWAKEIIQPEERRLGLLTTRLTVDREKIDEIAQFEDVVGIAPYVLPRLLDEVQGQILAENLTPSGSQPAGPGYLTQLATWGYPTDSASYPIVDITDDGFDNGSASSPAHPDFYTFGSSLNPSRVAYAVDRTSDGNPHNIGGHGTINASIVGGYNNTSGFPYEDASGFQYGLGIAPYTRVASSKIFRDSGPFGLIGSFTDLVSGSYALGSRILTNSWGAGTFGDYDAMDQEYDMLVRDADPSTPGNQEMIILFAAGNDGPSDGTTNSPGNAKNVLTVGAAENFRPTGTDGCGIDNSGADNANDMIPFSSRGPTDDGRVKPDVVAPGTHVEGAASQDPLFSGFSVCGLPGSIYVPLGQTLYTWSSGTSHSTPAAAGAASLLYERFASEQGGTPPSPAMLKAMMASATRYLNGGGAGGSLPTKEQGFGEVALNGFLSAARFAKDQNTLFGNPGESVVVTGTVSNSSKPLKVTLAWTDAPGPTVGASYVNNLDLEVTAGGRLYQGNVFNGPFSTEGGSSDSVNNLEAVFLPAGTTGHVAVRVEATTIAGDGVPGNGDLTDQDFALSIVNASEATVPVLRTVGSSVNDSDLSRGNGNGVLDPGETVDFSVDVRNVGLANATGVTAALSSNTTGLSVPQPNSAYPNLSPETTASNTSPFQVTVDPAISCGTAVDLTLSLTTDQGSFGGLPLTQQVGRSNVTTLLSADFESGNADFTATGLWHLENGCSAPLGGHSPTTTFYYGQGGLCHYDVGANSGALTSPTLDLSSTSPPITLHFNHFLEREGGLLGSFDIARVEVSQNGGPFIPVAGPLDTTGGFVPVSVDLSSFAGSSVQIRWFFDTVDSFLNTFEGWHIDDIVVTGTSFSCEPFGPPQVPSQTPWKTHAYGTLSTNISGNYAVGYHFTPLVAGEITQLGGFFDGTKTVKLFEKGTGTLLASASVTSSNNWNYTPITPVPVEAGKTYTVCIYLAGTGGSKRSNLTPPLPQTFEEIRIEGTTYVSTSGNPNARPTNTVTNVMYGQTDIVFVP